MSYKVEILKGALKQLKKLSPELQERIQVKKAKYSDRIRTSAFFNAEERGGKRRVTQSFRDKFSTKNPTLLCKTVVSAIALIEYLVQSKFRTA